ncbi:hypothetical protein [Yersinia proxima]
MFIKSAKTGRCLYD